MLTSLALILLVGLLLATLVEKIHLPRIVGMLCAGILLGPYVLNLLDQSILSMSAQLRQMALIIILIKAGLSLNLSDLKRVGRPAVLMAFLPATCEMLAFTFIAPHFFSISYSEAALMGAVLSAVSPAVVIPRMVQLMDERYGTQKSIPQLILAGASCDDVFVIVLFSTFLAQVQGGHVSLISFIDVPISIGLGIIIGCVVGFLLSYLLRCLQDWPILYKVIVVLSTSFLLMALETFISDYLSMSGLLAIVSMACILKIKSTVKLTEKLVSYFSSIWQGAEILLFVLVGATVDIRYAFDAGIIVIAMIIIALIIRSLGVFMCLIKTDLSIKERLFCVIAYLPKATVQAAIGSVPLSLGLDCGALILSMAVIAILITAPLGAIGMDMTYQRLLQQDKL